MYCSIFAIAQGDGRVNVACLLSRKVLYIRVYRLLCAGERPEFSRTQRPLYQANQYSIRQVMVFYSNDH